MLNVFFNQTKDIDISSNEKGNMSQEMESICKRKLYSCEESIEKFVRLNQTISHQFSNREKQ